jgi:hypothetical protein
MLDREFVDWVGELSVLGAQAALVTSTDDRSNEKFFHNFFKVARKLSEGMSQAIHVEPTAARLTISPSSILSPQTLAPSVLLGSKTPTNSPTAISSTASHPDLPIDNPVTPADPLETSTNDYEKDPNYFVSSSHSSPPTIESTNVVTVSGVSVQADNASPPNTSSETIVPPWFKNYIYEQSKGITSKDPDCKTIMTIMFCCSFILCL